jgi:hypothetical protein
MFFNRSEVCSVGKMKEREYTMAAEDSDIWFRRGQWVWSSALHVSASDVFGLGNRGWWRRGGKGSFLFALNDRVGVFLRDKELISAPNFVGVCKIDGIGTASRYRRK